MSLNFNTFLEVLPLALEGWLAVIVVIGIVVATVYALNAAFSPRKK